MNEHDRYSQWYKDAIIYELHVKAFRDSNGDGRGDFAGLEEKLDYLQDLGVSAVWLLPFYPSPLRDDGYDISDYRNVHGDYGTLAQFRRFVRQAHRRGIQVITELVINHTSDQHPWFQAARRARPGTVKRDYYVWSDTDTRFPETRIIFTDTETSNWSWDQVAGAYYWHRFFSHQPDLNLNNPRVVKEVIRVLRFWLDMGVDGVRLDAVPYLCVREGTNNENLPETHEVIRTIRREVDQLYDNRMLLAEANQWPDDVRPYFGNGDECHMAFHFPLMPRIYMALRQEDRHPVTEIIARTPEIPSSCQWALFLRNHDELTLEMVTDDERDYMYREYAADPRMRVNIGIRRRLAPLVNNSRRRMELLYSLLFSFPGTPVIYYGDEIGMGDNIYLGDRDGVRTPMQWSTDRNAGFSPADTARLYLPVNMDPVYGYGSVNVEAQQRDPSSPLHFMKRLIALRRQHRAFGRGSMEFLFPENRKVLAYIRRYRSEVILAVANLSRFAQPVELDLSAYNGWTPVEMVGRTGFPTIGELPYFLTLGPHAFYWFVLEPRPEPIRAASTRETAQHTLPLLRLEQGVDSLVHEAVIRCLERDVLSVYLSRQRWFRGKARTVSEIRAADWCKVGVGFYIFLVDVRYEGGGSERYVLPLKAVLGAQAEALSNSIPESLVAWIESPRGSGVLFDALADQTSLSMLTTAMTNDQQLSTGGGGVVEAFVTQAYRDERDFAESGGERSAPPPMKFLPVEQSNTSVLVEDGLLLKFFRTVEDGPNPDLEIGLQLTERTTFRQLPRVAGGLAWRAPGAEPSTLAMLQWFVPNQGDGWTFTLDTLRRFAEDWLSGSRTGEPPPEAASPLELVGTPPPDELSEGIGSYFESARHLGLRTAQFHQALASDRHDPAFRPEPASAGYLESLVARFQRTAASGLARLGERLESLDGDTATLAREALAAGPAILEAVQSMGGMEGSYVRIRCHGDYHLGQVLRTESDFVLIDFEGEPMRPLAERRCKHSALLDVAGMLRSFSYAAETVLDSLTADRPDDARQLKPWLRTWEAYASAAFLDGYLKMVHGSGLVPERQEDLERQLESFMLEKAFYELDYELNNRPRWVRVPLRGITRLAARLRQPGEDTA